MVEIEEVFPLTVVVRLLIDVALAVWFVETVVCKVEIEEVFPLTVEVRVSILVLRAESAVALVVDSEEMAEVLFPTFVLSVVTCFTNPFVGSETVVLSVLKLEMLLLTVDVNEEN